VRRLIGLRSRQGEANSTAPAPPQVLFGDQLDLELERAKRAARPLSVIVGELDPPTTTGADTAAALRVVASAVASEKRRIDIAAIIGDGRFALILPETAEHGALVLSERLRSAIGDATEGAAVTVSFGIATFPRHGRSAGALVKAADCALDAVRALGGDRSLLESAEMPATIVSVGHGDDDEDRRLQMLLSLAETVDIRDHGNSGHCKVVGRYAEQIARELGLPVRVADRVRFAGLLHDIGKVAVPQAVLRKPGPLDAGELEQARRHVEAGARWIDDEAFADVRSWVMAHHERPDGAGYPHQLAAAEIPLAARIIAVADAYESMTSDRPYRSALSHPAAQAELMECSGSQFDRRVVEAFLRVLEREGLRSRSRPVPTR
jgi:diguanylate cyclase (GGDEF)-like protein/putative nucleotidyltransferase with HDIG domain